MKLKQQYIIFTDLDGTLLNHHNYEYQLVLPLLDRLQKQGVKVILNSSKTLAELRDWRDKLGLDTPIIAENGGVVLMPENVGGEVVVLGKGYRDICKIINQIRQQFNFDFKGFNDWSVTEVQQKTGLQFQEAVKAKIRDVTEPILWNDSLDKLSTFKIALADYGLILKKGGRFYHVMAKHDKASVMEYLLTSKEMKLAKDTKVIALGDGENDLAMLQKADIAVVMPAMSGEGLQVENAYYAKQPAPEGWVEAIETILN